jgi:hypothetical protein
VHFEKHTGILFREQHRLVDGLNRATLRNAREQPFDIGGMQSHAPMRDGAVDAGRNVRTVDTDATTAQPQPEVSQRVVWAWRHFSGQLTAGLSRFLPNRLGHMPCRMSLLLDDSEVPDRSGPRRTADGNRNRGDHVSLDVKEHPLGEVDHDRIWRADSRDDMARVELKRLPDTKGA